MNFHILTNTTRCELKASFNLIDLILYRRRSMNQIAQFISSGRRIQFEHEKTIFFIDYDMNRYLTRKYRTYT